MSQPPNMTQSSTSASGLEPSIEILLEKALEKVVNNAIVQINEATTEAIDNAIKNSVEKIIGNCVENVVVESAVEYAVQDAVSTTVESAVEDAVESVLKNAVEKTVDAAVQNVVQKAVEKAVESAVENAVEKAVENSMAKYLDRSQELGPSHSTDQRDGNQNVSQTDVVSEIPETQQESMEIDLVTGNITKAPEHKHDDDSDHEKAALDILWLNSPYSLVRFNLDFFLAVNTYSQPVILSRGSTKGYQLKMCLWDFVEAGGWLHLRNPFSEKFLGIEACHGEGRFRLCLFGNIKKETRFRVQLRKPDGDDGYLKIPIGSKLCSMNAMLNMQAHRHDSFIKGEIHLAISDYSAGAIQIARYNIIRAAQSIA